MAVATVGEHYKCRICGNEVRVTKVGGGTLVCCGQEMEAVAAIAEKPVDDEIPVQEESAEGFSPVGGGGVSGLLGQLTVQFAHSAAWTITPFVRRV